MPKTSRRHSNGDFAQSVSLLFSDLLLSGILGMVMMGLSPYEDMGISATLAPHFYETEDTLKIPTTAILHLDIDAASQLYVDSTVYGYPQAEATICRYLESRVWQKKNAYLWIRVDRKARYHSYLALRDAIKRAERVLMDEKSIELYGEPFTEDFPFRWRMDIYRQVSICILEEPDMGPAYFESRLADSCYELSGNIGVTEEGRTGAVRPSLR